MRMTRSLQNSAASLLGQLLSAGLGFATRTVFLYTLSQEYLGLNGLFTSLLSLLSLSELGIGTAIAYALYQPLAQKDEYRIAALMRVYAKAYRTVGIAVSALGLAVYPLALRLVGEVPNAGIIYLLFLFNSAVSYFFSYKRALITADQKDWLNTAYQSAFLTLQNLLQIALLLLTRRYLLFLCVQIACTVACNVFIAHKAGKLYPFLPKYPDASLDAPTRAALKRNVAAMFLHQVSSVLVTGTDNLMIAWVGIRQLAVYSNYSLVTQTLSTLLRQAFGAVTASVGNLVATEEKDRQFAVYRHILFVNFWLYGFCAVALLVLLDPFITAWAPENYLLPRATTLLVVLNFFLLGMRQTNIMFINSAGLFWPLRYKSLVEALINLAASWYFLVPLRMGVDGVLLGTVISTLCTNFWWEPWALHRRHFHQPILGYFGRYALYALAAAAVYFPVNFLCALIPGSGMATFVARGAVCAVSVNLLFLLLFRRSGHFSYLMDSLEKLMGGKGAGLIRLLRRMAEGGRRHG